MGWRRLRHEITSSPLRAPLIWLRHRRVRPIDVTVASYPRSGSTWLRFLLYQLATGRSGEFESVDREAPGVKRAGRAPALLRDGGRLLQTHEPYRSQYRRAIYLVREIHDVLLSEHRFQLWADLSELELDAFVDRFIAGRVNGYGSWAAHVRSWFEAQRLGVSDIRIVRFRELKRDPAATLARLADFLAIDTSPELIERAIADNDLESMRHKEQRARRNVFKHLADQGRFVGKGGSGEWRDQLSDRQRRLLDEHAGELTDLATAEAPGLRASGPAQ